MRGNLKQIKCLLAFLFRLLVGDAFQFFQSYPRSSGFVCHVQGLAPAAFIFGIVSKREWTVAHLRKRRRHIWRCTDFGEHFLAVAEFVPGLYVLALHQRDETKPAIRKA